MKRSARLSILRLHSVQCVRGGCLRLHDVLNTIIFHKVAVGGSLDAWCSGLRVGCSTPVLAWLQLGWIMDNRLGLPSLPGSFIEYQHVFWLGLGGVINVLITQHFADINIISVNANEFCECLIK